MVSDGTTGIARLPEKVLATSGSPVIVQRATHDLRVHAAVLGSVPGAYIALRDASDHSNGRGLRALNLLIADTAILRLLHDGVAYGFRTTVSRLVTEPEYLLFLLYPTTVETVSVRQAPRTPCRLPCSASFGGRAAQTALMLDLNARGCGLSVARDAGGSAPLEGEPVTLSLALPTPSQVLQANGHVRRVATNDETWTTGITFDEEQVGLMAAFEPYLKLAPIA